MKVYGDLRRTCNPKIEITKIRRIADRLTDYDSLADTELITELLIDVGELESGLTDAVCGVEDHVSPIISLTRKIGNDAGRILVSSLTRRRLPDHTSNLLIGLDNLNDHDLPSIISITVPEGYAYYSLYPEMYFESAKKFFYTYHAEFVFCVGIRSIGTSLCSVVVATLESFGCNVQCCTVRPKGDFFDRHLDISNDLRDLFQSWSDRAYFLIIDEGPGLSGSSFCSTAEKLSELGIPDQKILFLPTWDPGTDGLISKAAKQRWPKHRKIVTEFEEVMINTGKLSDCFGKAHHLDISAGAWREVICHNGMEKPPVYPNNERRKYIWSDEPLNTQKVITFCKQACITPIKKPLLMTKFAGLGKYGRAVAELANDLGEVGFAPALNGYSQGFISYDLVIGRPLTPNDITQELMRRISAYIIYLSKHEASACRSLEEMSEMIFENLWESVGAYWADKFRKITFESSMFTEYPAVKVDGRMLPHEWLITADGYVKTDVANHHADHFFPGCQDIAWDIAGVSSEFNFTESQQQWLIESYIAATGDVHVTVRLKFYALAYLSYRVGYCLLASDVLANTQEGEKFFSCSQYYSNLLKSLIYKQVVGVG